MKKLIFCFTISLVFLISGCGPEQQSNSQEHLLQAVTWYQQSAEMQAIYIQSYNWATRILEEKVNAASEESLAVVLDIDETVLDNSPQTAQQLIDGLPFSDEMWDEWCEMADARPLPGVLDFTKRAKELGVDVYYISNRGIHLLEVSIKNLRAAGLPLEDADHILLKTSSSDKDERRARVSSSHTIALLIGDNLGDFSGIFDKRVDGSALDNVLANRERFGFEYIILPNPLYGSWEKPFRGESEYDERLKKNKALRAYRD